MLGSLLQAVRSTACTASKACMAGPAGAGTGSGFIKAAEANVVVQPTGVGGEWNSRSSDALHGKGGSNHQQPTFKIHSF